MGRQDRAEEVGAVGADQFSRMIGQDIHHAAICVSQLPHQGAAAVLLADQRQRVAHLARAQGGGGRREAAAGAGIYGDTHHNKPFE